jgi:hypothetical protein
MIEGVASLASVNDVRLALRVPSSNVNEDRDEQLRVALEAVESIFIPRLKGITEEGPQMMTYWDVAEDATLRLPSDDVTVTKVKVYEYPSSYGIPLSPIALGLGHGYDLTDDGKLLMRPTLAVSPFEGAMAQRRLRWYSRVEVHYLGTGFIKANITAGIAFLAAGWWQDGPRALSGLTSERIGDYSYTLGAASTDGLPSFWDRGMIMLQPDLKQQKVMVI